VITDVVESGIVEVEGVVSGQVPHVCGHCSASGAGQASSWMYCATKAHATGQVRPLGFPLSMTSSTSQRDGLFSQQATVDSDVVEVLVDVESGSAVDVKSVGDAVGCIRFVGDAV